jgi:hypothetical protein
LVACLLNMALRVLALLLAVGVLGGTQACSPVPGWKPKTVPELVALAPIVAVVNVTSVSGDWGEGNATAVLTCVVKNTSGAPLPNELKLTGFGGGGSCLSQAEVGRWLAFLNISDLSTSPPTYRLFYSDLHAGTKPATPENLAAAKSVMVPSELNKGDNAC